MKKIDYPCMCNTCQKECSVRGGQENNLLGKALLILNKVEVERDNYLEELVEALKKIVKLGGK